MNEISARALVETPLGQIEVCVANSKVVEINFVEQASETSSASSPEDRATAAVAASQLREYFAGQRRSFDLPLHFSGTSFQEAVWREIAKIPFGETVTYQDLAERVGKPKAARAVGGAVGANPLGIVVGCHRVMGSSGKLTGYSGGKGLPTKEKLLELEGISYK